jgi:thiol-disulfide isomerase/thioredoxin
MNSLLIIMLGFFLAVSPLYGIEKKFAGYDVVQQKPVQLNFEQSDYVVAMFMSSTCPCSKAHFDYLNDLSKTYPKISFVGFNSNKETKRIKVISHFKKFDVSFPILEDKDLKFANMYGAVKTPHVFVLNKKGEIVYQGGASSSRNPKRAKRKYLKEVLGQLGEGKPSPYKMEKALGCYIAR